MSRIPPNLVYLTIYNPTLHSIGPHDEDDEDAEEQAHILFYTSKERAVSRDKMLRQVGLAKALVNFAEMLNAEMPLDNVHSQTRRMIMVSPEPNFWIHACVELAKVPRVAVDKGKDRGKGKDRTKGPNKGKEKERERAQELSFEYEDGSVQNSAVKEDILRGYERFKLTHGSFASILDKLGQEALSLQLERFWTPWAWSWSLEEIPDFGRHFGIALHPHFKALLPIIDSLQADIPSNELIPLLLSRSDIAPSTDFLKRDYPIALAIYLMTLIPPPPESSIYEDEELASSQLTIKLDDKGKSSKQEEGKDSGGNTNVGFLGVPVPKWNWSGMLPFGKQTTKSSSVPTTVPASVSSSPPPEPKLEAAQAQENAIKSDPAAAEAAKNQTDAEDRVSVLEAQVDPTAIEDAMTSYTVSSETRPDNDPSVREQHDSSAGTTGITTPDTQDRPEESLSTAIDEEEKNMQEKDDQRPSSLPQFLERTVHLQEGDDILRMSQRKIYFLLKGRWMLVFIGNKSEEGKGSDIELTLNDIASRSEGFFETVEETIREETLKSISDSIPSATKILQPVDTYMISTGKYVACSKGFQSRSGALYEAKALQERDPEVSEVFSRGQNPQHWHISRKTHRSGDLGGVDEPLEVYMEVFRKEASLSDVDNALAGAVKNWTGLIEEEGDI